MAAYEGQGYSEKDAFWRAVRDQAASMGVSFAGGALSGGVMAGARVGIDAVDNTRQGAKLRGKDGMTQETYQAFVDEGLDSDPDSEAFRLAMQMQGKVDKKGKLSDYDLGRLYRANVAAIEAEGGMDTTEAEMGVEGEKTPSTAVDTDMEGHTPEQQAVIEAYQADTDETLKEVFQGYLENPQQGFSRHNISSVSQRQAQDAQRLLGGDYAGYRNAINSNGIQHILGEHGPSGTVDHSMADLNDIARMAHVLDNYDNVEVVTYKSGDTDYSREFRDKNDRPAPMLKFSKRVDGTYYVIEAVPEARYKKFWVVSAYMEKADGGTQAPDANGPRTTPNASLASSPSASVDRVSQTPGNVNRGEVARRQKMVWEAAETGLGENGAKALRYVYNETLAAQVEPQDAYRDFCRVYTATLQGEKMEDGGIQETIRMAAEDSARQDLKAAMAGAGEESQTFGKPAAEEADLVEPGLAYEDAATAEYLKRMDPREVERLDRVTRALGARVRVVDSVAGGAANAQIRGSEILMDKHTKMDVVSYVLGHEFTHQIQDLAEGEYMAFREALDQETLRYAAEDIQAIYQKEGREIDLEAAMDEAAANMAGKLLEDGALLDEFIERNRENKTLLERMRDVIRAIWSKLTGAERRRAKTAEGKLTAALDAAAKNAKQGKTGGDMTERYLLKGVRADGIEVYETSREVREMPYKDRMEQFQRLMEEEYSGRTARFEADGEILYARFDSKDIAKNIYGDKRSDRKGWKAKINTGADGSIFDLVENAKYNGNSPELGKEGTAHKGVNEWAYFVKTVQIDGNVFDLVANVRKKESGEFVYSIQLRENKTISTSPVAVFAKGDPALKVGDADENNIPQSGDGVKPKYSLKGTERVGRMSQEELAAVQSIGRKSVNELTSEEIKVVEPFARRYYQEMGAKSPFFRAWFGDWRVNDQTPVQVATKKGDARGITANEDTGWNIQVSGKVFNETAAHVKTPNVMAQPYLPFINDIVKKAILLDSHTLGKAKSQNSVMMHDLYAVADIGNGPEVLKLYVEEMNDPNQADTAKRAYQLQNIERQQSGAKGSDRSPSPVIRTADIKSVADLFQAVKARDKAFAPRAASKVVDGDGKPLVVYHATWAEPFTVFDRGRLGENTEGNASDPWLAETAKVGFWFSTQNLTGRAGNRAEAVYLDLKSPYQLNSLDALASELQERGGAEGMIDWLEEQGYDGLEVQDDEFGGTSYVVLNPTQIKSATDNIGTFDKENPDIRFSLKGTERVEDAAELRRENEELREKYEYWKKQTRRSQAGKVSEEVMLRRTRGLLRDYGVTEATMDSRTVAHKLQAVYDDIGSGVDSTTGGEMTFRAAKERVRHYNRAAVEEALERMKAQGK